MFEATGQDFYPLSGKIWKALSSSNFHFTNFDTWHDLVYFYSKLARNFSGKLGKVGKIHVPIFNMWLKQVYLGFFRKNWENSENSTLIKFFKVRFRRVQQKVQQKQIFPGTFEKHCLDWTEFFILQSLQRMNYPASIFPENFTKLRKYNPEFWIEFHEVKSYNSDLSIFSKKLKCPISCIMSVFITLEW